jgi:nucleoside-triphosphatase
MSENNTAETRAFAADAMLGRLAKKLRMLGYDVFYRAGIDDRELKGIALRERRVLLTRDHEVAETSLPVTVVFIESDDVSEQLSQVVERLGLDTDSGSFSRCTLCNQPLEPVEKASIRELVPPYVYSTQHRFARCPSCGRVYWEATHVRQARRWIREALGGPQSVNVFVTGRPGVGKTTLIRRVLSELDAEVGGFYTSEIREGGTRVGFAITALSGETGILAHADHGGPHRVGKYGVFREELERVGVPALNEAVRDAELIVMDEIGRMELCSKAFQQAVLRALDSSKPVLGTIQQRRGPFLDCVRSRPDIEVLEVTDENRDAMAKAVRERLERLLEEGSDSCSATDRGSGA